MRNYIGTAGLATLTLLGLQANAGAQLLGAAGQFAVLAGSEVTNSGQTTLDGALGVWPGSVVSSQGPGIVIHGAVHLGDLVAEQAQTAETTAYTALAAEVPTEQLSGLPSAPLTLSAGVYHFGTSALLSGVLTLDAQGDPNARFDFQIDGSLTSAADTSIKVINGGSAANVYWQIENSVDLGDDTAFQGNILALNEITLGSGSTILDGSAMSKFGSVNLHSNTVDLAPTPSPEPRTTILMLGAVRIGMLKVAQKRTKGT